MGQSITLPQPGDLTPDGGIVVAHYGELREVIEGVAWVTPAQAEVAITADTWLTRAAGGWHRTRNTSDSERAVQIELGRNTTNNMMRPLSIMKPEAGLAPGLEPQAPVSEAGARTPNQQEQTHG